MASEIDWSTYNARRKSDLVAFIRIAKRIIKRIGPPGTEPLPRGQRGRGRPHKSPTSMLLVNLLRIYLKMSYRDLEALLAADSQLRRSIGLDAIPGRSTINRYAATLNETYLRKFNEQLTWRQKKKEQCELSIDATGLSVTRYEGRWYTTP